MKKKANELKLPLGGKPVRFPKSVESTIYVRYARKSDNYNLSKAVLGCHIDLGAALYATSGNQTVAVINKLVDDENIFRFNKADAFTKLPVDMPLLDINGTKTTGVSVPGNLKVQVKIAAHIHRLVKLVEKEMSTERIKEIAESA